MSAGPKTIAFYESDTLSVTMPVEIDEQTLEAVLGGSPNAGAAGPVTLDLRARARKPSQAYGVGCRQVRFEWDAGQVPAGYKGDSLLIPVLTLAVFNGVSDGTAATYLGGTGIIKSKISESKR